jgi:integrase
MKKLCTKSVNNCVNLLFAIFRKGEEWGMVERNPVRIRALKVAEQKYAWWDKKEYVAAFLEESSKSPYHVAFRLALECGLRLGEIVGLSKEDVSLERCQLHIHRQWVEKEGAYGPTKGRRERFVPFHPDSGLKEVLKAAMERSRDPEAIVVTPTGSRVLNRKLAGYHFNKLVERAQVPKIRFHDLRHTFASWYMIEVGDIWSLKGILGHVDVQTTQRYAHLSQRHHRVPILNWMSAK